MSGSQTLAQPSSSASQPGLGTVDCDVHPHLKNGLQTLRPYLSRAWQRRLLGSASEHEWAKEVYASQFTLPKNDMYINPVGAMRRDSFPEGGAVPGSDPDLIARQLLDGCGVDRAVLLGGNVLGLGALPDADAAATVASAYNEWLGEEWLQRDRRFRGTLAVAPQDPGQAVAEIDRVGDRPGIVAVLLPLMGKLMGDRHYYPIYSAAERHGLPITVHPNSVDGIFQQATTMAGGIPTYYVEWHTALSEIFQANVISLACHGVFEQFPGLKVVVTEGGFAWLPDVMWRLDQDWEALRDEVPWVKQRPSEYILEHVRFTTQPFPEPSNVRQVRAVLEIVQAERTLLFSSDYPHWDFDNPQRCLHAMPEDMRARVRAQNAIELYGDRIA
jgi:predicted TIM-barrel fold metal-dependent hydrolase